MAYKFQLGAARLSGSTTFEEAATFESSLGANSVSSSNALEAGGNLITAGTVKFTGVADTAIDVAADSLYFKDADGLMKAEAIADLATAFAGNGLAASSGVLAVGVDDSSIELNSDALRIKAAGVTDAMMNDDVATGLAGVGLSAASGVMALDLNELSDAAVASGDKFAFVDATDNSSKVETIDDMATFMAGDALAAASGVLAVSVDDSSIETNGDALRVKAAGITNSMLSGAIADSKLNQLTTADKVAGSAVQLASTSALEDSTGLQLKAATAGDGLGIASQVLSVNVDDSSIEINSDSLRVKAAGITDAMMNDDVATGLAGDGLAAASGVLAVQVSGAAVIASDKVGISGSIAGAGLTYAGGVNSISGLAVGEITNGGISALPDGIKMDLAGLAAAAVDAANDSIAILDATDSSTKLESIADLAIAMAGNGIGPDAGTFVLDLNELSAAAVDASADSIAIIDATDNSTKKESIADLVTAMAGAGLSAASGVLSVTGNNVATIADGGTLAEGYNFFSADLSAAATVTLPASPAVGDVVVLKAKGGVSASNYIAINRAGSQTIDGETSIRIESPFGAVSMVYVASNDWRLI
jgi:hypothetical protein